LAALLRRVGLGRAQFSAVLLGLGCGGPKSAGQLSFFLMFLNNNLGF